MNGRRSGPTQGSDEDHRGSAPAQGDGAEFSVVREPIVPGRERERTELAEMQVLGPPPPLSTRRDAIFRWTLATADLAAAAGGLGIVWLVNGQRLGVASLVTLPLIVVIMKLGGRYDRDDVVLRKSTLDEAPALAAVVAGWALVWSLVTVAFGVHSNRSSVIVLWAATVALLLVLRAAARATAERVAPVERVLIIGGASERTGLARRLQADALARVDILGFIPIEDERRAPSDWGPRERRAESLSIDDLGTVAKALDVQRVILIPTSAEPESLLEVVSTANVVGLKVSIVPSVLEVVGSAVEFDEIGGVTALGIRRPGLSRSSTMVKRAMDLVCAGAGLIVLAPLGLMVALAIKLDTPGPVFFRQPRVGRNGRAFEMIKFRSMVDSAEQLRGALEPLNESDGVFKMSNDPRVTRVGRFLRRSSLDELPQLLNVLRGKMSLVGPRPLLAEEDRRVEGPHRSRLQLTPGMTGPWQVLGPERPPLSEMVKLDYLYGANWSLFSDVKFLLRTLGHVIARRGV